MKNTKKEEPFSDEDKLIQSFEKDSCIEKEIIQIFAKHKITHRNAEWIMRNVYEMIKNQCIY